MGNLHFDFTVPPVDPKCVSPEGIGKVAPFQSGSHSSWTGAVSATEARSANITALRQLYREPRTRQEIAAITGFPINSVCSLTDALEAELEIMDYETVQWGPGRKDTKRERLRLKR